MAESNIFKRLRRLFSTQVIVRNVGGRKLKIADTEHVQTVSRRHMADRFNRLYSNMGGVTQRAEQEFKSVQRLGLFRDYEEMDADSIIASALDIYSDESTMKSEYGKVLEIETEDDNTHADINNLLFVILDETSIPQSPSMFNVSFVDAVNAPPGPLKSPDIVDQWYPLWPNWV